ncbi:hypothetical protein THH46_20695 [Pseudomonas sp. NA13]
MQNTIIDKDGKRYNIMIVPDKQCTVNKGLSSTRGGQLAKVMYSPDGVGRSACAAHAFMWLTSGSTPVGMMRWRSTLG